MCVFRLRLHGHIVTVAVHGRTYRNPLVHVRTRALHDLAIHTQDEKKIVILVVLFFLSLSRSS